MSIKPSLKTISKIPTYVPGGSKSDSKKTIKLSSNENALGTSPKVKQAFAKSKHELHRYPDATCVELREELGKYYNLPMEQIICSNGSDELIRMIAKVFASSGDEVLSSQYGFLAYEIAALAAGAKSVIAKEKNFTTNIDNLLTKVTKNTKIIFLANPNNPTGTSIPFYEIKRLHKNISKDTILVLDSAYSEFIDDKDYKDGLEFAKKHKNIVILKTFSKIFGLGGVRVGWGFGSKEVIDFLYKIRDVFPVSLPAQRAAIAALNDKSFTQKSKQHTIKWVKKLNEFFDYLGFDTTASKGNFVTITTTKKTKFTIDDFFEYLKTNGIVARPLKGYKMNNSLRISIGTNSEMKKLIAVAKKFCSGKA